MSYYFVELKARLRHAVERWFRLAVQIFLILLIGFETVELWMRPEGQWISTFSIAELLPKPKCSRR